MTFDSRAFDSRTAFDSRALLPTRPDDIDRAVSHFAELRESQPVYREEGEPIPRWHVFAHRDVGTVLSDSQRFSSKGFPFGGLRPYDPRISNMLSSIWWQRREKLLAAGGLPAQ